MTMSFLTHQIVDLPIGAMTLVARDGILSGVYMDGHRRGPTPSGLGRRVARGFETVRRQLEEYFAGDRRAFELETKPKGTPFQRRVWSELSTIPYGETRTYTEVARAIGEPTAVRAVAGANARNPLSVVVPCHRVIGRDGSLTGYAGGLERKRFLLDFEDSHRG
jgi:methylated-DNA-[protein]-cysteine S-methyltransferase